MSGLCWTNSWPSASRSSPRESEPDMSRSNRVKASSMASPFKGSGTYARRAKKEKVRLTTSSDGEVALAPPAD